MLKPRVLLVPEGGLYLAFRLPRLFQSAGWDVDLLCLHDDLLAHSRYVGTTIREMNQDALFVRLQSLLRDTDRPWQAVIVAHEKIARQMMASGGSDLLQDWQPGAMDPQVREFLLSKFGLESASQRRELMIPPARVCQSCAEIAEFGREVGWPIVLKPPHEAGGAGVVKYISLEELESNGSTLTLPILAQKFIQGRRGVVDMLCSAGRPMAWLASYSTKRCGGEFHASTARLFRAMPALQPLVEQVARFTKFEGFCGFDWIEEEATGRHYLIEFHPRPPSGFRFGRFCGVDFTAAITAWLKRDGGVSPPQVQAPGSSVAAQYFSGDLLRCFRQRDWPGLKLWLPGSGTCHDVFWDDPLLFTAWVAQRSQRLFKTCLTGPRRRNTPSAKSPAPANSAEGR